MTLARRQWIWIGTSAAVLVVLCGVGSTAGYLRARDVPDESNAGGPAAPPKSADGAGSRTSADPASDPAAAPSVAAAPRSRITSCDFAPVAQTGAEPRLVAKPAPSTSLNGKVRATIRTNLGALAVELDAAAAPCTVYSFTHLAREDYYAETKCHRVTTADIWVLQCGDPEGTGAGSPGYAFDDEHLPTGVSPAYPRGTLAMANSGPRTNGGQFFVVYRDSDIPPDYTVFGRVTAGIDIVERVAAGGTQGGGTDGRPKTDIQIDEVVIL